MQKSNFIRDIEKFIHCDDGDLIDAIITWCTKHNQELEMAAYWIKKDPVMRSRIQLQAENLNLLKHGARLPI